MMLEKNYHQKGRKTTKILHQNVLDVPAVFTAPIVCFCLQFCLNLYLHHKTYPACTD